MGRPLRAVLWTKARALAPWLMVLMLSSVATVWALQDEVREGVLELIMSKVRTDFPEVAHISTQDLSGRLARGEKILLLDVRREEEFAVSRLPGAIRVEPGDLLPEALDDVDPDADVVAYCSVGYRSSQLVDGLRRDGYSNAVNLEGSIFRWIAEGRPLEDDLGRVAVVHPYSQSWSFLVDPEWRAFVPRAAEPSQAWPVDEP